MVIQNGLCGRKRSVAWSRSKMRNHSTKINDADLDFHKSSSSIEATLERGLCVDFLAAISGTRGLEMSQSDSKLKKKRKKQKGSCIVPENCGRDCDPPEGTSLLDLSSTEINRFPQSPVKSWLNLEQEIAQSCLEVNCCQLNIEKKEQKERQSGLGINGAGCDIQVYSSWCGRSPGQFQSGLEEGTRDASSHCLGEVLFAGLQENLPKVLLGEDATSAQVMGNILEEVSFCVTDGEPTSRDSKEEIEITNLENNSHELSFVKDVSVRDIPSELFEQKNGAKNHKIQMTEVDMLHGNEYLGKTALCAGEEASKSRFDSSCKHPEQTDVETENKMEVGPSSNSGLVKDDADLGNIITSQNVYQISDFPLERALMNPYKKKLLILYVNGLLADVVSFVPYGYKVDIMISGKAVFKRPCCGDFLEFCFDRFDVGVWSSRTKRNMDMLIDFLIGDFRRKLLFCWDQSHCTSTGFTTIENKNKPLVFKELRKLWEKLEPNLPWEKGEYNEANTLLLDDSPYKALLNPVHTAIFPHTYWYTDVDDRALGLGGDLQVYLEGLAVAEDVQKYVKQNPFGQRAITEANPSWGFYRKVIDSFKLSHVPVDGLGVGGVGSRQTTSSPSSTKAVGQILLRAGGDQCDPLFHSIEPSSNSLGRDDHGQKQEHIGKSDTIISLSGTRKPPLDVEEEHKEIGAVASTTSLNNDEYGETADAEVGAVENESPSIPMNTANMSGGEIEIDQIKSSGKSRKSKKDSVSMKHFKIAVANFVKEVLKPSWRQGNISKEAFKTIVKKTVDKVSGVMKSHQIPKSQAKIDQYIDSSQRKLTNLVMGYVDKYVKV